MGEAVGRVVVVVSTGFIDIEGVVIRFEILYLDMFEVVDCAVRFK